MTSVNLNCLTFDVTLSSQVQQHNWNSLVGKQKFTHFVIYVAMINEINISFGSKGLDKLSYHSNYCMQVGHV